MIQRLSTRGRDHGERHAFADSRPVRKAPRISTPEEGDDLHFEVVSLENDEMARIEGAGSQGKPRIASPNQHLDLPIDDAKRDPEWSPSSENAAEAAYDDHFARLKSPGVG